MEWEVGKWYINPGNHKGAEMTFGKFLKIVDRMDWCFSEQIYNGEYINRENYWYYPGKPYFPINIEEIKQYLPMDHPDLEVISKETNYNYLIPFLKALK